MYRKQKDLARDLINVFPVNEFAIRTYSTYVHAHPSSGEFGDETAALSIISDILYKGGATYTGEAIQETVALLKNEQ